MGNQHTKRERYTLSAEQYDKVKHLIDTEHPDAKYRKVTDFIGTNVFIRTVTMFYTGHIEAIDGKFVVLSTAAWVADTGRFSDFMKGTPTPNFEVEPMGDTLVNLDAVLDISPLQMELPLSQK